MRFRLLRSLFAVMAFSVVSVSASAATLVWTLNGVTFADGGTAFGSFAYDATTNTYSAINITTTPGSVRTTGATYAFVSSGSPPSALGVLVVTSGAANQTGLPLLFLAFTSSALSNTGGSRSLTTGEEANCANAGCTGAAAPVRFATAGSVAALTLNATFTFNDATAPQAVDRMLRDHASSCATPGTPLLLLSPSTFSYETRTAFNNGPARCVTVTVTTACVDTNDIAVNAYSPTVTPATRTGATWLGEDGDSSGAASITFRFNAPANAPIVFLIERASPVGSAGLTNCDYTIQSPDLVPAGRGLPAIFFELLL